ncbi:hypothetical protein Q765_01980 [Flavobacterium rivuli WB 3.3-2 = DSM 21788]|uniref:Uncharacterized protein n=1 Tax=Flavobacterium rivuli WB 3.3-2 = DSM 21788 TaxID=1121895 RepID=A0A0A2MK71_9FLAO|nr:hypothetical protein Q765_01980 [Flavobacterium rivuli WB 3.3-2 = DSM 21788]
MQNILNFFNPKHYGSLSSDRISEKVKEYLFFPFRVFKITLIISTIFFILNFVLFFYCEPESLIVILMVEAVLLLVLSAFHVLLGITFIIFAIADRDHAPLIAKKISVVLLNIPIGILYIYILKSVFLQS